MKFLFYILILLIIPVISFASIKINTYTTIVLPEKATDIEKTSADELKDYIRKITKISPKVVNENTIKTNSNNIYIGNTNFARSKGFNFDKFDSEEWLIKSFNNNLVLAGGYPSGTIYAVYKFIEEELGVRWWNPYEEYVPNKKEIFIKDLNLRGKPSFKYRDISVSGGGASYPKLGTAHNSALYGVHNRLNRVDCIPIEAKYGGWAYNVGLPWLCHTFYTYIHPDVYFKDHPEYFPEVDGKRTYQSHSSAIDAQLCLTNKDVRRIIGQKLRGYIEESNKIAKENGMFAPNVYDISQNDTPRSWCDCADCKAIKEKEGSMSGPLIDMLNEVLEDVNKDYPDIYVSTLAYQITEVAPKYIEPNKNLIIRLTNTESDFTLPITAPRNIDMKNKVDEWAKKTKNIEIYEYGVNYNDARGLPYPNLDAFRDNLRYYNSKGILGVYYEYEWIVRGELRDLNLWVLCKLLEDPNQDYNKLILDFTNGYYGKAGKNIRDYRDLLEKAYRKNPSEIHMNTTKDEEKYLTVDFLVDANSIFNNAAKVADNDIISRRVRQARLPIDRSILLLLNKLNRDWNSKNTTAFPFNREDILNRYLQTTSEQLDLRKSDDSFIGGLENRELLNERSTLEFNKGPYALPKEFAGIKKENIYDYPCETFRVWGGEFDIVKDDTSSIGHTIFRRCIDIDKQNFNPPMMWGIYDTNTKQGVDFPVIKREDLKSGYNWYKAPKTYKINTKTSYIWLTWCWWLQIPESEIEQIVNTSKPDDEFEVWVSMKFTGPYFYDNSNDPNTISIDRVIIVKK